MKVLADPGVNKTMRDMFDETVKGAHMLTLATLGLRDLYGKKEIHKSDDLKGVKVRIQATATEDAMFPAYGAQTVHMPFGDVYTALQTGVVEMAENGVKKRPFKHKMKGIKLGKSYYDNLNMAMS